MYSYCYLNFSVSRRDPVASSPNDINVGIVSSVAIVVAGRVVIRPWSVVVRCVPLLMSQVIFLHPLTKNTSYNLVLWANFLR